MCAAFFLGGGVGGHDIDVLQKKINQSWLYFYMIVCRKILGGM